jgi:hypothetical protein
MSTLLQTKLKRYIAGTWKTKGTKIFGLIIEGKNQLKFNEDIFSTAKSSCYLLTLIKMAYSSPDVEWPKIWSVLAVPSLQMIQKF